MVYPSNNQNSNQYLRPFDLRQDLGPVADLVEFCFADTLDPDGKRFLQRMRSTAENLGFLRWAAVNTEWTGMPFTGYVWEQDGKMVGNASLIPYNIDRTRCYLIANVAVHPDFRRKGIARTLTVEAIAHARQRGARRVWLHVREENDQAQELYASLDFVEQARRTSWFSSPELPSPNPGDGATLASPQDHHWASIQEWIKKDYPEELTWHLSLNTNAFRPGFWGRLYRLLHRKSMQQWAALLEGRIIAAAAWQSSNSYADTLWLAAPPGCDEEHVQPLLLHVRHCLGLRRPLRLDYPARKMSRAFKSVGFYIQQTLIWMSLDI